MKKQWMILSFALLGLTSCGTVNEMICLINNSTEAIYANEEAVEASTEVIRQNAQIISASTEAVKENRHQLEAMHE